MDTARLSPAGPTQSPARAARGAGGDGGATQANPFPSNAGTGGNGGTGGIGVFLGNGATLNNAGTVAGGAGGNGGSDLFIPGCCTTGRGGNGAAGGAGVSGSNLTIVNSGTISGGAGGNGGIGVQQQGPPAAGGSGIIGSELTITNSGTISGGANGTGFAVPQANAITFTGGSNTLTLAAGSTINGNIDVAGSLDFRQPTDGTLLSVITGAGHVSKSGAGTLTLAGTNTYFGGTTLDAGSLSVSRDANLGDTSGSLTFAGGTLQTTASFTTSRPITFTSLGGAIDVAGGTSLTLNGTLVGGGGLTKGGLGTLLLTGNNNYLGGTTINAGTLALSGSSTLPTGALDLNGATAVFDISNATANQTIGDLSGVAGSSIALGANALSAGTSTSTTFDGVIGGSGGFTKQGSGSITFSGANTYTGATTVTAGTLALTGTGSIAASSGVNLTTSGAGFDISATATGATIKDLLGVAGSTIALGAKTLTFGTATSTSFSGTTTGTGGLIKQGSGIFTWSGNGSFGALEVAAGQLTATGNLTGNVTVDAGANFLGTATITGNLTVNGSIRPDIGTTNVIGSYTQGAGSTYTVEVTPAGLSDKINVTGNAVINGGTVAVVADAGTYQRTTRYTILTASTGVAGTYAGVTSNFAFLRPTLSYDANDVFLTLLQTASAFETGAQTPNQKSVGHVLDLANPTAAGDFNTVLNALSGLGTTQGPAALDAIGGQNYSGFSSLAIEGAKLFMDSFQMQAGGGASGGGGSASLPGRTYLALKAADCDNACDVEPLWGAWGGGVGAFGTIAGDNNSHGLTYNLGGFVAGLDRKFGPGLRAGVATGFNAATLYTQGMPGTGTSNTLQLALYGEYAPGPFYLDALAGYGHSDDRMNRPIVIPGLPFRVAQGYTTANTFFGQLEAGYKIAVAPRFGSFVTPFARLQASTSTQNGFSETGADSLNLTVAPQTTNSLRTVLGIQLGAGVDAPWHEKLDLVFRLGWSHEYADLNRPVTASFAGTPALAFTTFGASAPRDGALLGLGADTAIAERTHAYLRYDGDLAGANTVHVLSAGIRYVW